MRKVVINLEELLPETRQMLALDVDDQDVLDELAKDSDNTVRIRTARRTNRPTTIYMLAKDKNPEVRKAIAANPNTSKAIIDYLMEEDSIEIQNFIIRCCANA